MANNVLTKGKNPSIPSPTTKPIKSVMEKFGLTSVNSTPPPAPTHQTKK